MRLIDADMIDTKYSDPEVSEILNNAPTVQAIPLDEVKQARIDIIQNLYTEGMFIDRVRILGILNRLVESEG